MRALSSIVLMLCLPLGSVDIVLARDLSFEKVAANKSARNEALSFAIPGEDDLYAGRGRLSGLEHASNRESDRERLGRDQSVKRKLTEDMLVENRMSRAGNIRFFDPPKEIISSKQIQIVDFRFSHAGEYYFKLGRKSKRLKLFCGLSDDIRKTASYALRAYTDSEPVMEQTFMAGDPFSSNSIDVSGVEILVLEVAGSPSGGFMLFYCRSELD